MRTLLLLTALFFSSFLLLTAQNGIPPVGGARAIGMGGVGVTFTDINALFSNQAGLGQLESTAFTAFAEQRFLLQELQSATAGFALPTNSGTFGISVNYFGFEDYNEQRMGLAYGRALGKKFSIGAQALLLNTRIPEYGNRAVVTFELGLLTTILPNVQLGLHLYSPARISAAQGEYLPSVFRLGLDYQPSDNLRLITELEKDIDYPVRAKFGVEYRAADPLLLRGGLTTQPVSASFGVGYELDVGLSFDVASAYHEFLGFTPSAGVGYVF